MSSRRKFIFASLGSVGAMAGFPSCSLKTSADSYENVANRTWRHGKLAVGDKVAVLHELVRDATLAPSSHNTQCWKFRLDDGAISILPDLARRCSRRYPSAKVLTASTTGSPLFGLFFTPKNENDKYAKHVRSSAGIAIFVSDVPSPAQWMEVGRCYERFALQSAALGIRNAMLNQPVEVSMLRPQFATFLGIGNRRPDLVVGFGRGPKLPSSLRRPVAEVLV